MERRRQEQQKLQKEKDKVREGVDLVFRWDPPAVDGVVTPEAQHPLVFELRKARPKDTGPEAEADRRLRLAKTYLASAMEDKAAAILKDVLANYPNTQAAAEARELYASLLPGGEAPKPK